MEKILLIFVIIPGETMKALGVIIRESFNVFTFWGHFGVCEKLNLLSTLSSNLISAYKKSRLVDTMVAMVVKMEKPKGHKIISYFSIYYIIVESDEEIEHDPELLTYWNDVNEGHERLQAEQPKEEEVKVEEKGQGQVDEEDDLDQGQ